MARQSALATRCLRFLARPLVRGALLMRGATALAGDLALLVAIHRREATILDSHELSALVRCKLTSTSALRKNQEKFASTSTTRGALSGSAV
jgi:hypothetical protein